MKKYQFQFSPSGDHDFAALDTSLRKRILKKIALWEKVLDPFSFAKRLIGRENTFRFRIGDYRLIVVPKNDGTLVILVIVKIGHRKEIYRFE